MDRKEQLIKSISQARDLYYNKGNSGIEDVVYDAWVEEYRVILLEEGLDPDEDSLLSPDVVGAASHEDNLLEKATHKIFMGSLDNSMDIKAFQAFDKRVGGPYYCNPKFDGASLALYYEKGKLVKAITRGNGIVGDDITANVLKFKGVPSEVPGSFTGAVRGEAILFTKDWLKIDPDQESNPRNKGSGIIQRSDGENCNLMHLLAFDIVPEGYEPKTEVEKQELLIGLGFEVRVGTVCNNGESVIEAHALLEKNRKTLPFWIDGLVVKANDIEKQKKLGISGKRPRAQTAFKFVSEKAKATLLEVIWTVGHHGDQIPTGHLSPVRLGGTTVSNALLCNMDEIDRLQIAVGDEVEVYKAGEIIPKIFKVVNRPKDRKLIPIPDKCVVCGAVCERQESTHVAQNGVQMGAAYVCTNNACEAKSYGKLKSFIKKTEILGVGDAVLTALVDSGMVKTIPDLYRLQVDKLAALNAGTKVGKKRAEGIVKEFEGKRKLTIDLFLGSLGIKHLGRRRTQIIRENVKAKTGSDLFDRLPAWLEGKLVQYKDQAGVPGIAEEIQVGIERSINMINDLLQEVQLVDSPKPKVSGGIGVLATKKFCLTGKMSKERKFIAEDIVKAGGSVLDDVSDGDTILVQADPNSASSKSKKIKKLHPENYDEFCISEEQLYKLMKG